MESSPQHQLIAAAAAGDQAALTALLTETYATLRGYLARRIPADLQATIAAEDLVQETHVEVFRRIGDFRPDGDAALLRWVQTIAANRLRNAIRNRRAAKRGGRRVQVRQPGLSESITVLLNVIAVCEDTPSQAAARDEIAPAVADAIAVLLPDQRQAVTLVYLDGLSVAEAAKKMNRTERAVHNLCYKARRHLREALGSRSDYLT